MPEIYDHNDDPVLHHMARLNGIRLRYIIAGSGSPFTFLTPHFSIIALDLRGFGATDKPPASEGYDGRANAKDMAECYNTSVLDQVAVNEWTRCSKASEKEILDNGKLECKVMTFFGPLVEEQMKAAATSVVISEVFEDCGHSLSLEQPKRLAELLVQFLM
ncbi:hypothetical protein GQ44DRAFT_830277 [Phaeosphaeriaceae sp. PMI808]|nr:hypothetical protein GQ44DRAFT_830277 [Phaeosphaeriaceae sp. PMI808]